MPLIEVLKWDGAPRVFAYKYPNAELNTKSQLIVTESQEAVLLKEGKFYGPFGPGRHVLDTKNYPFLTKMVTAFVTGGESPFTAEVWYVQKAIPLDIKWGTMDPIQVEDPKYHIMLPVRAFGQYGVQITNTQKFLSKLVGRVPVFVEKTLTEYFRGIIITRAKDCIGSCLIDQNISVLQMASKLNAISTFLQEKISADLDDYGVSIVSFMVNSISTDEKDPAVVRLKEALAKKAEMDIIGYTYQQERSFDTMETAAGNEGSGSNLMSAGMGLGLGVGIGAPMGNMMGSLGQNLQVAPTAPCSKCGFAVAQDAAFCPRCGKKLKPAMFIDPDFTECDKCKTRNPKGAKFCSNCGDVFFCCSICGTDNPEDAVTCRGCGKTLPQKCPGCGTPTTKEMKFCSTCATPLQKKCPSCDQPVEIGLKFCPGCGTKLS